MRFRAANQDFRYTHDAGTRESGWETRVASIVVTDSTVLIYQNEKVGIEIMPSSRRLRGRMDRRDSLGDQILGRSPMTFS